MELFCFVLLLINLTRCSGGTDLSEPAAGSRGGIGVDSPSEWWVCWCNAVIACVSWAFLILSQILTKCRSWGWKYRLDLLLSQISYESTKPGFYFFFIFYAFATQQCRQRRYFLGCLIVSFVCSFVRLSDQILLLQCLMNWTAWTVLIKLAGNIH